MREFIFLILILCAFTEIVKSGACPFTSLVMRAEEGVTLENAGTAIRARAVGAEAYCGPPLCNAEAAVGRRVLTTTLRSNGFPELYSTTVTAIQADFCSVLNGGCDTDRTGAYTGVTSGYTADFDRADVAAGVIQLAFHDAGTYDPKNATDPAGPDGCACDKKLENVGLDYIKGVLQPIYEKYSDYLSLADFWVICANTAIEVSRGKGEPVDGLDFQYGRTDNIDCDGCSKDVADRLPDSEKSTDNVVEVFHTRMGFTFGEIVALMGAHSLGRMEFNNSGYEGVWDQTFSKLDQRYFIAILSFSWCRYYVNQTGNDYPNDIYRPEWRVPNEMNEDKTYFSTGTPKLLNTDMCLAWAIGDSDEEVRTNTCPAKCMSGEIWDECTNPVEEGATTRACSSTSSPDSPSGKQTVCDKQTNGMRTFVETYASNVTTFIVAFCKAFKKLTELGQSDLASPTVVSAPSDLTYSSCTSTCAVCVGETITSITPSYTGSTVSSFSVDPSLPDGLSLDTSTGVVLGTPTSEAVQSATAYTVTASNDAGTDSVKIRFRVISETSKQCTSDTELQDVWTQDGDDAAVDTTLIAKAQDGTLDRHREFQQEPPDSPGANSSCYKITVKCHGPCTAGAWSEVLTIVGAVGLLVSWVRFQKKVMQ